MIASVVCRQPGQVSGSPSGVLDQSTERIRAPASPPPRMNRAPTAEPVVICLPIARTNVFQARPSAQPAQWARDELGEELRPIEAVAPKLDLAVFDLERAT